MDREGRDGRCQTQEERTREASLLHEVPLEGRVSEQEVVELVHAEVEDFVHILPATQVLIEGLDLPCTEDNEEVDREGKRQVTPGLNVSVGMATKGQGKPWSGAAGPLASTVYDFASVSFPHWHAHSLPPSYSIRSTFTRVWECTIYFYTFTPS